MKEVRLNVVPFTVYLVIRNLDFVFQVGSEADCFDGSLPWNHLHRGHSCVGTHLCSSGISQLSAGGVLHKVSLISKSFCLPSTS